MPLPPCFLANKLGEPLPTTDGGRGTDAPAVRGAKRKRGRRWRHKDKTVANILRRTTCCEAFFYCSVRPLRCAIPSARKAQSEKRITILYDAFVKCARPQVEHLPMIALRRLLA